MKRLFMTAAFAVCLVVHTVVLAAQGPESAVVMAQEAIESMDVALFDRHVAVAELTQKGAALAVKDPELLRLAAKEPALALALAALGGDAMEALTALLAHETQSFVRYGVASGAFAGTPGKGEHPGDPGLLGSLLKGDERDKKSFGPVTVREQTADTAVLATTLHDGVSKKSYALELFVELKDGTWQVKEVRNLKDLLRQTRKE